MYIYYASCKETGRSYVGQTGGDPEKRFRSHIGSSLDDSFHNDLKKFHFDWSILECMVSEEDIDKREVFWINEKNTIVPNGYNLTPGGRDSDTFYSYRIKGYGMSFFSWLSKMKDDGGEIGYFARKFHVPYWKIPHYMPRQSPRLELWEDCLLKNGYGERDISALRLCIDTYRNTTRRTNDPTLPKESDAKSE